MKLPTLMSRYLLPVLLCAGWACSNVYALDTIILDRPLSGIDKRNDYAALLLNEVLRRTEKEYGPYKVELAAVYMERKRLLEELKIGKMVNVAAQPSQPSWEQNLKTIFVPVDMGLQSWRISLIDRKNQERLHSLNSLDQLKRLSVGVGAGWATYALLQDNGFNIAPGTNYDGLFEMLMAGRFDYFLRGVNEIYPEFDDRKDKNPSLQIEDSFIVHIPLPWLFFTSPNTPRLAQRISAGMEMMVKDGSLQRFMLATHKDFLIRAKLCSRKVFEVPNPNVTPAFLARKAVWFDPLDPKNGICPANTAKPAAKAKK